MYKVKIDTLKSFKKALEDSNKTLLAFKSSPDAKSKIPLIDKQIKANNKQIKIITDEYYID